MLSTKCGRNYYVLRDDEDVILKLNRSKTNKAVQNVRTALESLRSVLKDAYKEDYSLYMVLRDNLPFLDFDEGKSFKLDITVDNFESLNDVLNNHKDDVAAALKERFPVTFERLGYHEVRFRKNFSIFEKKLSGDLNMEVSEEVVCFEGKLKRRKRITYWKETEYGKSSDHFKVRNLRITEEIQEAFRNYLSGNK